jgi:hypothetical protein|tara:strand:- start:137 stop:892 length:756 start_codon:yes stop_codon:yes gene_type:complete
MANTTSGTTTFDKTFAIDDIVEESFERIGIRGVAGYQLKTARRSLNLLFQEWANRGIHLWQIADGYLTLVAGTNTYNGFRSATDGTSTLLDSAGAAAYGLDDIFEASYRSNAGTTSQSDSPLTKISRSTYSSLSNKLATGQPSQYWVQRFIDRVSITLYTTPSASQAGDRIQFYYMNRIQDAGVYTNATDIPYYYTPCMCAGLAYYLSLKYAPDRTQNLKMLYEDELLRAEAADGSEASTYITPKTYYPSI